MVNMQACEPTHKRFNKGGFFTGVSTACGMYTFLAGCRASSAGKKLLPGGEYLLELYGSPNMYIYGKRNIFAGRVLKGAGVGLIFVPMLVNNRELLRDQAKRLRNAYDVGNE
jgi:hypothetical protein